MSVRYTRVGWQDAPSTDTPIDAANLNHMDNGILALSEEVDTELPLLQEQINDISTDIDTQIDEKVPPEVSSWLTEHVDPVGSAVVVDGSLTIQGAAADAKKTGDEISDLKDGFNEIGSDKTFTVINTQTPTPSSGYYWNGAHASTSYKYAHITGLKQGDFIYIRTSTTSVSDQLMRFVDAYNGSTRNDNASDNSGIYSYTVPQNVDNVYVSYSASYPTIIFFIRTKATDFVVNENTDPNRFIYTFDVSANGSYTTDKDLEDICGYRICFFAKIGTFSGITRIGKAETMTYGGAVGFDETNLYTYLGSVATATKTQAHGLTLKDYVGLVIDLHYNGSTTVTLSTNGGKYSWDVDFWRSQYGTLTVNSASALSGCVLSYTCEGILKESWLYGDSYFSNYGTIRWTAFLVNMGYDNYLLNAFPGRGSEQALRALKTDLSLGKMPKRIIWCMGMNDSDANSAPNNKWMNCLLELEGICTKNNIELILATIPNVPNPTVINAYKNDYVKSSGYRYIPFASAISADESSTWYDGMLETVSGGGYGIHPTEQGAICLFNCAVSAVPELLF